MALTDAEQDELLTLVRMTKDGIFKTAVIEGSTTGGNSMPGGLLRMASINYDWQFGVAGKKLDLIIASLASSSGPVDAATVIAKLDGLKATLAAIPSAVDAVLTDDVSALMTRIAALPDEVRANLKAAL